MQRGDDATMMESDTVESSTEMTDGGVVALLDLPERSILSLDGEQVVLKRDDFVGFTSVPSDGSFHLVTVRAGSMSKDSAKLDQSASSVTVGFTISGKRPLIRRFDLRTEEVSSEPVDELAATNLLNQIREQRIEPQRVVPYSQLLVQEKASSWRQLTEFITSRLLEKRGLREGEKIVPGSYGFEEETKPASNDASEKFVDGKSIIYPSVPIMNTSHRHTQHAGTKRFMANLSPAQRTALFTASNPSDEILESLLKLEYDNQWKDLLGDIQLAYVLFLHLHCFSSLEHWRDLVAMLSMVSADCAARRVELYSGLLQALSAQVATMESDFFDDTEFSGDNFLIPALQRLLSGLSEVADNRLADSLTRFSKILSNRYPSLFGDATLPEAETSSTRMEDLMQIDSDEVDDEDGPVVVSSEEVEASLARSAEKAQRRSNTVLEKYPAKVRHEYPLLFAAMMPHEDVLMTCARALDDASDVSLVREAAAYLEQVEAKKTTTAK